MNIQLSNKTILVTGGAGFIGSNLCEELLRLGNKVFCFDNFSTGNRKNIIQLLDNSDFTLIEGDIRNFDECLKACQDVVMYTSSAIGSVPRSIENPIKLKVVLNLLVAGDNRVKRFVYDSSSLMVTRLCKVENNIGKPLSPMLLLNMQMSCMLTFFENI